MMPGSNETALLVRPSVAVAELTGDERVVALYASDMPDRFRSSSVDKSQVAAWIVQGAERIGLEGLRREAAFFYGHRLLEMSRVVPVDVQARHEQRFPKTRRLEKAESLAAATKMPSWMPMTPEPMARNGAAEVEGGCPCRGTRSIKLGRTFSLVCPVHGRATARQNRAGVAL